MIGIRQRVACWLAKWRAASYFRSHACIYCIQRKISRKTSIATVAPHIYLTSINDPQYQQPDLLTGWN